MKKFLAIDFGTTQSSVALMNEGSTREPEIIEINDGQRVVKSIATAMQLDENGNILHFGAKALAKAEDAPERTFQNFKVFVGSKDNAYQRQTSQDKYTPDKLAFLYLNHLRKLIEEHHFNGAKLSDEKDLFCVIGCPSDWDNVRKENLKKIAEEAGYPNVKLCDESVGVIYYNHFFGGLKFKKSQNILVYDFGGGTTDVAIARVDISDNGEIKPSVLAVGGVPNLGGSNFDNALAENYIHKNNYDLSRLAPKDLLHDKWVIGLAAREAKEVLSSKGSFEKTINRLKVTNGAKGEKFSISRDEFMSVCADLVAKFDEPIYDTLTYAGLSPEDIDFVILAGGSSAMPYVREKMSKIFPSQKIFMSPSTEVIAQGLSLFGKIAELGAKILEPENNNSYTYTKTDTISQNNNPPVKKRSSWLIGAAVILIGAGLMYGYTQYAQQQEQIKIQIEQERLRAERARREEERKKAEEERKRLEQEKLRAEQERQRAERELYRYEKSSFVSQYSENWGIIDLEEIVANHPKISIVKRQIADLSGNTREKEKQKQKLMVDYCQ